MKLRALLVGENLELAAALPSLLARAGFVIDVITTGLLLKRSKFIADYEVVQNRNLIPIRTAERNLDIYDFIIVIDDETLGLIAHCDIPIQDKLKILPIKNEENLQHIFSKIGLSKALSKAGVNTPPFLVAQGVKEVIDAAEKLEYPVMVKTNSANGGSGVFECKNADDIKLLPSYIFSDALLVQKKIDGIEVDLSALYQDEKLIHFSYSKIEKVIGNKFGTSSVRTYKQLALVEKQIFLELENLGKALGANGFVTISCIISDNKRYFIEADMRESAWVEFAKFIGDDPAIRIAQWFSNKQTLTYPYPINKNYPEQLTLPYFIRLSIQEILFNRYNVWKYMPWEDLPALIDLLGNKIYHNIFKPALIFKKIKYFPTTLIKLAVPDREDRLRVKLYAKKIINRFLFLLE